ncbi:hypothetical protein HN827_01980 [archaeon]|jgi:hypothetical protein|nr:hypothetical protein [archaeon]MBT4646817.1 hypothetical protein [archaeon]MBT6821493.1 hypothetical protein [archaeon]MBT7391571.1 hypothetical protein [archaeon]
MKEGNSTSRLYGAIAGGLAGLLLPFFEGGRAFAIPLAVIGSEFFVNWNKKLSKLYNEDEQNDENESNLLGELKMTKELFPTVSNSYNENLKTFNAERRKHRELVYNPNSTL